MAYATSVATVPAGAATAVVVVFGVLALVWSTRVVAGRQDRRGGWRSIWGRRPASPPEVSHHGPRRTGARRSNAAYEALDLDARRRQLDRLQAKGRLTADEVARLKHDLG